MNTSNERAPITVSFYAESSAVIPSVVDRVNGLILIFSGQVVEMDSTSRQQSAETVISAEIPRLEQENFEDFLRERLREFDLQTLAIRREFAVGTNPADNYNAKSALNR